jgi:hypothetical protein
MRDVYLRWLVWANVWTLRLLKRELTRRGYTLRPTPRPAPTPAPTYPARSGFTDVEAHVAFRALMRGDTADARLRS